MNDVKREMLKVGKFQKLDEVNNVKREMLNVKRKKLEENGKRRTVTVNRETLKVKGKNFFTNNYQPSTHRSSRLTRTKI
ncbi:MAG: hypothetical protein AB7S48_08655 [Bacteroidales bacterium]